MSKEDATPVLPVSNVICGAKIRLWLVNGSRVDVSHCTYWWNSAIELFLCVEYQMKPVQYLGLAGTRVLRESEVQPSAQSLRSCPLFISSP